MVTSEMVELTVVACNMIYIACRFVLNIVLALDAICLESREKLLRKDIELRTSLIK